ncbi:MAG: NTP transferase domain-containing protein [Rhodospirillales bacterium]|nr:NTP transferase domain-containing protein [Rhodospirillales bacterium]
MKPKIVSFVPMKLKNERLPDKHFLPLNGKPLCWHIFASLLKVPRLDAIYLYASDPSISAHIPPEVRFELRDPYFDGPTVKGLEFFAAFAKAVPADFYVLAHATAPFLRPESIAKGVAAVEGGAHDSAFTVQRIQTYVWFQGRPLNYKPTDMARTQDIEPILVETSGFYVYSRDEILNRSRRIGDRPCFVEIHGFEAIDIDYPEDYDLARRHEDLLGR